MKILFLILLVILISIQITCTKKDDNNLNSIKFKISVEKNNKVTTYTYDLEGNILSCSNNYNNNGIISYEYKEGLPVEKKYVPYQNGAFYYTITYTYNKADKKLSYHKKDDIAEYKKTYILNDDHSVSYILNVNSDTISSYNYFNGLLKTIVHSNGVDSLFYDTNLNLIEVKSIDENSVLTIKSYYYNNKNKWLKVTCDYSLEYTYSIDDKLTNVIFNNEASTVIQKNHFNPINMNPINFYRYPYLELEFVK